MGGNLLSRRGHAIGGGFFFIQFDYGLRNPPKTLINPIFLRIIGQYFRFPKTLLPADAGQDTGGRDDHSFDARALSGIRGKNFQG